MARMQIDEKGNVTEVKIVSRRSAEGIRPRGHATR